MKKLYKQTFFTYLLIIVVVLGYLIISTIPVNKTYSISILEHQLFPTFQSKGNAFDHNSVLLVDAKSDIASFVQNSRSYYLKYTLLDDKKQEHVASIPIISIAPLKQQFRYALNVNTTTYNNITINHFILDPKLVIRERMPLITVITHSIFNPFNK